MRITRLTLFALLLAAAVGVLQSFPSAPSERAELVCRPVRLLTGVAGQIASSMNDSGHIGPSRQPWREDAHRVCLRIAERVFTAAAES
jgi:hypothetical protein